MGETAAAARELNERELALRLHALSRAEQKRLLARLPRSERKILTGLLNELRSLGIPKDAVQAVAGETDSGAVHEDDYAHASQNDAEQILRVMDQEPEPVREIVAGMLDTGEEEGEDERFGVTDATREALMSIVRQRLIEERFADE